MSKQTWMIPNTYCWFISDEEQSENFFEKGKIISLDDDSIMISHKNKTIELGFDWIFQANQDENQTYDDMVQMDILNEPEILHNLEIRYSQNQIFTFIGPTLMVINPYQNIPGLVGQDTMLQYLIQKSNVPHTYAVAAGSYRQLFENQKNQAIVISGESGAGKTETTKTAMSFLTSLSQLEAGRQSISNLKIEECILACNPVLEAFGNAKTVRNDNSSRFGKYVRIIVDGTNKRIRGATITNYLLEKSRVTTLGQMERNYHVFYALLCGDNLQNFKLQGLTSNDFKYLNGGGCIQVPTINDQEIYKDLVQSFEKTSFTIEEQDTVFKTLSTILFLGNLEFDSTNLGDTNPCKINNNEIIQNISYLLDIQEKDLIKTLLFKIREIGKQFIESPLNEADAYSNRNALAANLYDRLFTWLVKRLNLTIIPPEDLMINIRQSIKKISRQSVQGHKLSIGLLDIFGFENFKENSFEQYCINYTNEKLQQLYIQYVFKSEEKEFMNEGLKDYLNELQFKDNSDIIELLDKPPLSIFDLIDESSQLGSGTDEQLFQKITKLHKDNSKLEIPKFAKDKFTIHHTAKDVEYTITNFRLKNKSEISSDIVKCIVSSKNDNLQKIFLTLCGDEILNKDQEIEKLKKPSKTEKFLGAKFRQQMKNLMDELNSSDCHFIRCLKPNHIKKPQQIDKNYCLTQIEYLGVLESVRVRKEGFPFRKEYNQFYQQYHEILPEFRYIHHTKDIREQCIKLVTLLAPEENVLKGSTRFFAKDSLGKTLDQVLTQYLKYKDEMARKIQRTWKNYLFKKSILINLHILSQKIKKFYVIMAHFKRRKQRRIFLSKKKAIVLMNHIQQREYEKSCLLQFKLGVKYLIEIERIKQEQERIRQEEERIRQEKERLQREEEQKLKEESERAKQKEEERQRKLQEELIQRQIEEEQERQKELELRQQMLEDLKNSRLQQEELRRQYDMVERQRILEEEDKKNKQLQEEKQKITDEQQLDLEKLSDQLSEESQDLEPIKITINLCDDSLFPNENDLYIANPLMETPHSTNTKQIHDPFKLSSYLPTPKESELKFRQVQSPVADYQQIEFPQVLMSDEKSEGVPIESVVLNQFKLSDKKSQQSEELVDLMQDSFVGTNMDEQQGPPVREIVSFQPVKEQQESESSSESLEDIEPTYIKEDLFPQKNKQIMQSSLKKDDKEDPNLLRKRLTVSNNILPFVPKDKSQIERFLVDRSQFHFKQPQFDETPTSQDLTSPIDKLERSFMEKILNSHFLDYCETVVRKQKRLFTEIPINKIMRWTNQLSDRPLKYISQKNEDDAKKVFELIYKFAGEIYNKKDQGELCEDLISMIFGKAELVDEAYLLTLKQITKNPSPTQLRYCQLLVGLTSSVAPSPKALFPILNYLYIGANAFKEINISHAKFVLIIGVQSVSVSDLMSLSFLRLMKTFSRGRKYPPGAPELRQHFSYRQLIVPIYIYGSNADCIYIEPHYTERQTMEVLVRKYQLHAIIAENLGICRFQGQSENFIEPNSLMVDELKFLELKTKDIIINGTNEPYPYLTLKIKIFYVFQPQDLDSICIYYLHFANEYLKGNFPASIETTLIFACMKLVSEFGCFNKNKQVLPAFTLKNYIPKQIIDKKNWQQLLSEKYKHFPNTHEMEARARFLEEIRKFPTFLTWQYPCNYVVSKNQVNLIILAIRPFQIYFCDFNTREVKTRYHFLQVIVWGQQNEFVTIETDDEKEHRFQMTRGKDDALGFNSLMKTYMDRALMQQEGI